MKNNILAYVLGLSIAFAMTTNSLASPASSKFIRNNLDGSQTLLRHMPKEVNTSQKISHANSNQMLDLRIVLPLQNQAQLSSLIKSIYDPKSPIFHHFITPTQFAQQFGASQTDILEVSKFLKSQGLSILSQSANGFVLHVAGSVNTVERAFKVHVNNYKKSDGTKFYAPDTDPTIPAQVIGKITAINGLDNLVKIKSHAHLSPLKPQASPKIGHGPTGGFSPADIYKAYNLNGIPSNGSGQTVALCEFDGYLQSDINTYEAQFNLPNVPVQNELIDGFNGFPFDPAGAWEVTADIELVAGMAFGLSQILVYEAPNTDQSWVDEWTQIALDNKAKVISCSWGENETDATFTAFDSSIFQQMSAQGQEVFNASGDCGANDGIPPCNGQIGVLEPAAQPFVTGVGISVLSTFPDGSYYSEYASTSSGGGISTLESIPSYQQGMISQSSFGSTTMRNVPDLALTADPSTLYSLYNSSYGGWVGGWGSSFATPIWASLNALINEGRANAGESPLGFINPALYAIAQGNNYSNDFHDITLGNNRHYPAVTGYDDATGLGSFNGAHLYNDLVSPGATQPLDSPANFLVQVDGSINYGTAFLRWNASTGATGYVVKRGTTSGFYTASFSTTNLNYLDEPLTFGTTYYYVVQAVNSTGLASPNSTELSITPLHPPATPSNVIATAGHGKVNLAWTAASGATIYFVYRGTASGSYSTGFSTTSLNYTDTTVTNGTTYYYVILAYSSTTGEYSSPSSEVSATPISLSGNGVMCAQGSDCQSGVCSVNYNNHVCTDGKLGSACGSDAECTSGYCSVGNSGIGGVNNKFAYCTDGSLGSSCYSGVPGSQECQSGFCGIIVGGGAHWGCTDGSVGTGCLYNNSCQSGNCDANQNRCN